MAQTTEGAMLAMANKLGMTLDEYRSKIEAGYRRCTRCKEWKKVADFGKDRSRKDGVDRSCFDCRRVKERKSTKGRASAFKGQQHTEEAKQKMRDASRGNKNRKDIKHSLESRLKMSKTKRERDSAVKGERHYAYKDGSVAQRRGLRFSAEYKKWRYDVFARDLFTCQECGDNRGGNLVAHHIKPFADFPDLRFDVGNGITLCSTCHDRKHFKPDSIRNKKKINQFTQ